MYAGPRSASASGSTSPSATSRSRRWPRSSAWPSACSIPRRLLGGEVDIGITCALLPRDTPGITIGRRHFPLNIPFQNGPIQGQDVFVPLDAIIGGTAQAGRGWRMLVEQLSVGRCISLPAIADRRRDRGRVGHRRLCAHPQAVRPAGGQVRGRRAGHRAHASAHTYIMDAARSVTTGAIDGGEKARRARGHPQVPRHRDGPHRRRTTRWTCTAARA